jgi:hypothetical protein
MSNKVNSSNLKSRNTVNFPRSNMDDLAVLTDDDLGAKAEHLYRELDKTNNPSLRRALEEEICYVARELEIRMTRSRIHSELTAIGALNTPEEYS